MVGKKHFLWKTRPGKIVLLAKLVFFHQLAKIILATENQVRNVLEFDRY